MNNIDVTRGSRSKSTSLDPGKAFLSVTLENSDEVAHQRIVATVRWLLDHSEATQRDLAELLDCDVSVVNRALKIVDDGPRKRRRDWRAGEVYRLAVYFDLPVETFYGTNVEEVWEQRMQAARAEHQILLKSLGEGHIGAVPYPATTEVYAMPTGPDREPVTEEDLKRRDEETNIPEEDTPLETEGDPDMPPPAGTGVS